MASIQSVITRQRFTYTFKTPNKASVASVCQLSVTCHMNSTR